MRSANQFFSRFTAITFALATLAASTLSIRAQDYAEQGAVVDDWSTHHVIYSDPGTERQAFENGTHDHWLKVTNDPRYIMQQRRRNRVWNRPIQSEWPKAAPAAKRDWAVSLGTGTVAENMYPAKFTFSINATPSCTSDYVAYGLNVAGVTGGQANLVALNQLYSGAGDDGFCSSYATAQPFWAYNVSYAGGTVTTSPVISNDATGSKIIFVESGGTSGPYLHILVWESTDGGTATDSKAPAHGLTGGQITSLSGCTAGHSCLVSILLNSTTETVTNSSPFYDYAGDTAYVGDDAGNLYKITPVLGSGTPVVTKLNIEATVGADTSVMTGPTYDASSGYVFVGASNGEIYAVKASTFSSVAASYQLGDSSCSNGYNRRLTDPPIVDSANGWVYEYVTTENNGTNTAVFQASTAGPFTTENLVTVGEGDNGCNSPTFFPTHALEFDNNYYTGTTGGAGTIKNGHIWVCGRSTGSSAAELWEIPTSAEVSSSYTGSIAGVTAAENTAQITETDHEQCSPFTEIFNGTTDYLFFGEGLTGTGGMLYGFTLDDAAGTAAEISGSPITYPTATGGTSAIVIDNVSLDAQASSIYFTTQAESTTTCGTTNAYCAIKLTQSTLH